MLSRPYCHSAREVFDYLYHAMRDLKKEIFKVLFLDAKNQILEEKTLFEGTVDSSAVYPREIMKDALRFNAAALIFVHNHPSGDPEPSLCDREITKELVFAARVMGLKVLDHLVIGNNCYFSFADHGLISDSELLFLAGRENRLMKPAAIRSLFFSPWIRNKLAGDGSRSFREIRFGRDSGETDR
jgi:DNA repair protein RadC